MGKFSNKPSPSIELLKEPECNLIEDTEIRETVHKMCTIIDNFNLAEMFEHENKQRLIIWQLVNYKG